MNCKKCRKEMNDTPFCPHCGAKQSATRTRRGNGSGSAYKRGNYWQAQITICFTPDGKRVYARKGGFRTKKEALAYLPELLAQGAPTPPTNTLEYYYESWLKADAPKLSKSKQTAYKVAWNKIKALHDVRVADLRLVQVRDIVSEVAPTFYPARDIKSLLSHVLKLAIADGQIATNLSEHITLPPMKETEREPWSDAEIATMWRLFEAGDHMAAYLLLMTYTGMMPGELFICEKDMIDLDKHTIVGAGLKTEVRKAAPIVLPDIIVPVVEQILTFTPPDNKRIVRRNRWDFYDDYHAFTKSAGIRDLPMYSCRHTTATALAKGENISPTIIQKAMRHSKFSTTQHYIHHDITDVYSALNTLGNPSAV